MTRVGDTLSLLLLCVVCTTLGFLAGRVGVPAPVAPAVPAPSLAGTIRFYAGSDPSETAQALREALCDDSNRELLRSWRIQEIDRYPPAGRIGDTIQTGAVGKRPASTGVSVTLKPALVAVVDGVEIGRRYAPIWPTDLARWVRSLRPWWREPGGKGEAIGEAPAEVIDP